MGYASRARARAKAEGIVLPGKNPDPPTYGTVRFLSQRTFEEALQISARLRQGISGGVLANVAFSDRRYSFDAGGQFRRIAPAIEEPAPPHR